MVDDYVGGPGTQETVIGSGRNEKTNAIEQKMT